MRDSTYIDQLTEQTEMNQIYKVYDPDGNAIIFEELSDIREALDLTDEDIKKIFYPGVHKVSTGDEVITY